MLTQYTFTLDLDAPRLMPHTGGLKAMQVEINIVSDIEPTVSLDDDYLIAVSGSEETMITSYIIVCEYHLCADYLTSYVHRLMVSEKDLSQLLRTWKIKPGDLERI